MQQIPGNPMQLNTTKQQPQNHLNALQSVNCNNFHLKCHNRKQKKINVHKTKYKVKRGSQGSEFLL